MNLSSDREDSNYPMDTDKYIKNTIRSYFESSNNINFEHISNCIYFQIEADRTLIVHLPHKLFADWFDLHIRKGLEDCIYQNIDQINSIKYRVKKRKNKLLHSFKYDSNYKFDNFLYNYNNYLSYMSIYEFSQNNITSLNSALITGNKGTGKTHLLKAIANYKLENDPEKNILYLPLDNLHTVYNQNQNKNNNFIFSMHLFDIILLDDLHKIDNYPDLQNDLISIYDYFYEQKKMIIFACRGKTQDIELLENQLKSRLESSLIVSLKDPDLDIKIRYLQEQNNQKNLNLNQNQLLTLAGGLENFQNLYAAIVKIVAHQSLKSNQLNASTLQEIIDQQSKQNQNSFENIILLITNYFQYSFEEIKSQKRSQKLVLARQAGMFLCREILGYSYPKIGSLFGGRDHSTVIHSIKKIEQLQEYKSDIKFMLKKLKINCAQSD